MSRFHLPSESWSSAILSGDEARHLTRVLRIRAGAEVTVFDGCGRAATATVRSTAKDQVVLELGHTITTPTSRPAVTLAQAIPKQKNMDLIVQKAVELGVCTIQPLITHHTIVQPGEGKADKWRRIALEACKQCGQNNVPKIHDPMPLSQWLTSHSCGEDTLPLIASLTPGAQPLRHWLQNIPRPTHATWLVGPEGDFSPDETEAALSRGFLPASLGSIVLRVETATLFGLSALAYEFGYSEEHRTPSIPIPHQGSTP
jgi:16S rRNA (uracil1498-N3)-methyltransferase